MADLCYSILGNVNVYTQGREILAWTTKWEEVIQCSAQVFKRAGCHLKRAHLARWTDPKGRHFSFLKKAGRHQKGAGRCALPKWPRQSTGLYSLSKTVREKDLGVSMNANMKVSEQCRIAASKVNQVHGMISRNITYERKEFWLYPGCIKQ